MRTRVTLLALFIFVPLTGCIPAMENVKSGIELAANLKQMKEVRDALKKHGAEPAPLAGTWAVDYAFPDGERFTLFVRTRPTKGASLRLASYYREDSDKDRFSDGYATFSAASPDLASLDADPKTLPISGLFTVLDSVPAIDGAEVQYLTFFALAVSPDGEGIAPVRSRLAQLTGQGVSMEGMVITQNAAAAQGTMSVTTPSGVVTISAHRISRVTYDAEAPDMPDYGHGDVSVAYVEALTR